MPMPPIPGLVDLGLPQLSPKHQTWEQAVRGFYQLRNPATSSTVTQADAYNATTAAWRELLAAAHLQGTRLRPIGATWSMSRCAASDGWIVDTSHLNHLFRLRERSIHPAFGGAREMLWLAQAGCQISGINRRLMRESPPQSLPASGASNGQTIAGAIATGTHGSAFRYGDVGASVRALHLVTAPDRSVWLQRASAPATVAEFAGQLGADPVFDDALFEAALVHLGAFGVVAGVLFEARALFTLRAYRARLPFSTPAQRAAIVSMDPAVLPEPLAAGAASPGRSSLWHYSVVIDPFDLTKGVFVTAMYDAPPGPRSTPVPVSTTTVTDSTYAALGTLLDLVPDRIPFAVSKLVGMDQKPFADRVGTLHEHFPATDTRGKTAGVGIAGPADRALEAFDLMHGIGVSQGPFPCILAMRFVPGSAATLGFTRWARTCVLDIDGPDSKRTRSYFSRVFQAFADRSIPYAVHWGKVNSLGAQEVQRIYGGAVATWKQARATLLPDPGVREVFRTEQLMEWGLHD